MQTESSRPGRNDWMRPLAGGLAAAIVVIVLFTVLPVHTAAGPHVRWGILLATLALLLALHVRAAAHARRRLLEEIARREEALVAAEEASRAKSAFVAMVSHEIRTPFHGVLGMIELALDLAREREQRDYLRTARESAEYLLQLIEDVLDLSRIEAGRLELEETPFDLLEVLEGSLRILLPRAIDRGIDLRLVTAHELPFGVRGDPVRLRQVLLNLLGNAIKFTERGEVVLSVDVLARDEESATLRFAVRDTGPGIPADRIERIFEPFRQADPAVHRQHGGTGLGLAISRRIVEAMGGRLECDSTPGQGSVFHFTARLPLARADEVPVVEASTGQSGLLTGFGTLRVLVAEDHPVNRKVVGRMLEKDGHRVVEAENGQEALEKLDPSIDVVLMDVRMPVMDGIAASRAIRALEEGTGRHVPIIALTGAALPEDREACVAAGMDACLVKPVTRNALFSTIARVLGEARTPAPASS